MDTPELTAPALALRGLAAGYGGARILHGLDLQVDRGELVGLVGPSGSGKTTVLRAILARADRHAGTVEVFGRAVERRVPARVGYVPQLGSVDLDFPLTVLQVVLLGESERGRSRPWFTRAERRRALEVLDELGLAELSSRSLRALSGGQLQRTFLARALVRDARLLLLDEPTSGVDLATRRDVLATVSALHQRGLTVVLTTHDLNMVAAHLPRTVCLNGRITADGPPAQVLTPQVLQATYGAPMRVIHDRGRVVVVDDAPLGPPAPALVFPERRRAS
ncbi:MAG: metal ABC transporter ATP-binding protein [Nitriliruptoraceae bacterium]|nr:metal ABC transporter ATP-binding protein [Nitriliruptoraceae bacterium]